MNKIDQSFLHGYHSNLLWFSENREAPLTTQMDSFKKMRRSEKVKFIKHLRNQKALAKRSIIYYLKKEELYQMGAQMAYLVMLNNFLRIANEQLNGNLRVL